MILRFHAARMGVSYLPSKILQIGDKPPSIDYLQSTSCPYTGNIYSAIPSLKPDVALIHAQKADKYGNVQMWGIDGDTIEGALASDKIIVSVEKIIDNETLKLSPEKTVIPSHRVTSIVEVPFGAYPSYVSGFYSRDDDHYKEYDSISRDEDKLAQYLDEWIYSSETITEYQEMIGKEKLIDLEKGPCGKI